MAYFLCRRVGHPLKHLSLPQRYRSQQQYRAQSAITKTKAPNHEPTPSQILRYALTGTTKLSRQDVSKQDLDDHLNDVFLGEWRLSTLPPPLWSSLRPKAAGLDRDVFFKGLEHDVRNLRHLQIFIERHFNGHGPCVLLQVEEGCKPLAQALERCQQHHSAAEILVAINALVSRLQRMQMDLPRKLHLLGMYYACLSYSTAALERHLRGSLAISPTRFSWASSVPLVDALYMSIRSFELQGDHPDTGSMLKQVTGEPGADDASAVTLHSILFWAGRKNSKRTTLIGRYFRLLVKLKSRELLHRVWRKVVSLLWARAADRRFCDAYSCITALVVEGDVARATTYLEQISKRCGNALPHISGFKGLSVLLANQEVCESLSRLCGEDEYLKILEFHLEHMEKRLGIKWLPERSLHTSISDLSYNATGQPLLTMDGDSTGYESSERLIAEMHALGCSGSLSDLTRLANCLDEHGGEHIPVVQSSAENTPLELAWVPQRCPVDVLNSSEVRSGEHTTNSPSSLGLIRLDPENAGLSSTDTRSLHLIQLGYLIIKPKAPSAEHEWRESGHIVALDRASGQLFAVFVGKAQGQISLGIQSHIPRIPFDLKSIMKIELRSDLNGTHHGDNHSSPEFDITKCYLDVDPCKDLVI
ncbi:uncharacterized protein NFIA_106260 [Aspergillus fischeri NRRL 181]|uniref:Uncharacterized protein n=1 Tax=Neosartorya fischeri (strain ATCC 1020 / DSM 3700 / CBS 544.65 / FGSC A1164 / JCM 1740 / NRRL 181 / WB 181) TaxID=331117 RepID=A1CWY6_NEOFI|nr:conserved hypothetical protein [Aspergillus fischeri NRRL 181]EAW25138.1 conserved hypothetical protein [Aspergillus fischeri NRRL 181]KAG2027084.1 hypothetical protein GB937_000820 [Aspergillus fischeri]